MAKGKSVHLPKINEHTANISISTLRRRVFYIGMVLFIYIAFTFAVNLIRAIKTERQINTNATSVIIYCTTISSDQNTIEILSPIETIAKVFMTSSAFILIGSGLIGSCVVYIINRRLYKRFNKPGVVQSVELRAMIKRSMQTTRVCAIHCIILAAHWGLMVGITNLGKLLPIVSSNASIRLNIAASFGKCAWLFGTNLCSLAMLLGNRQLRLNVGKMWQCKHNIVTPIATENIRK